jgi:hypothetical protein
MLQSNSKKIGVKAPNFFVDYTAKQQQKSQNARCANIFYLIALQTKAEYKNILCIDKFLVI